MSHNESCQCHLHKMPLEQTAEQFDFFTSIHGLVFRSMPITQVHRKIMSQSAAWERTLTSAIAEWRRRHGLRLNSLKKGGSVQFSAYSSSASESGLDLAEPVEQKYHNHTKGKGIVLFVEFVASRAATALSILTEHEGVTKYTSVTDAATSSQNAINIFECLVSAEGVCRSESTLDSWISSLFPSFAKGCKREEADKPLSFNGGEGNKGGVSAGVGGTATHLHIVGEAVVAAVEAIVLFGALPRADVSKWYCEREKERIFVSRTKRDDDDVDGGYTSMDNTLPIPHTSTESVTNTNTNMGPSCLPHHVAASLFFFWCMFQRSGVFSGVSAFSTSGSSRLEGHDQPQPSRLPLGPEMKSAPNFIPALVQRALLLHSHSEKFLFFSPSPSDKAFCSFLARYITLNGQDASGYTPLHYCARGSGGGGVGVGTKESSIHASQKTRRSSDYLFLRALSLNETDPKISSVAGYGFPLEKVASPKEGGKAPDCAASLSPISSILSSENLSFLSAIEKGEGRSGSSPSSSGRNDEAFTALLCPSIAKPRSSKKAIADSMSEHLVSSIVNARLTTSSIGSTFRYLMMKEKAEARTTCRNGDGEGGAEELGSEGETAQTHIARAHVNEGDNAFIVAAVGGANTDNTSYGSLSSEKMVILAEQEELHGSKSVHFLTRAILTSGASCVGSVHEAFSRAATASGTASGVDSSGNNGKGGGAFAGLGLGGGNPTGLSRPTGATTTTVDSHNQQLNVTSYTSMPSSIADLYVSRMPIVPTTAAAAAASGTSCTPLQLLEWSVIAGGAANMLCATPAGWQTPLQRASARGRVTTVRYLLEVLSEVAGRVLLSSPPATASTVSLLDFSPQTLAPSSLSVSAFASGQEVASAQKVEKAVAASSAPIAAEAFAALRRYCVEGEDSSGRSALSLAQDECPTDGGLREIIEALLVAC